MAGTNLNCIQIIIKCGFIVSVPIMHVYACWGCRRRGVAFVNYLRIAFRRFKNTERFANIIVIL